MSKGVVEMMLDATENYVGAPDQDTACRLACSTLPDRAKQQLNRITVGAWRPSSADPMQVVSGPIGKERVHYEAPEASRVAAEMRVFFKWFEGEGALDLVLKAAVAHLWFVTVHPFEDGNGRIARAIADMTLARSEGTPQRFYAMSSQIRQEREAYYDVLEATQKGDLDITDWLDWFLGCLDRAFDGAENILATVLAKARFWNAHAGDSFNDRQRRNAQSTA